MQYQSLEDVDERESLCSFGSLRYIYVTAEIHAFLESFTSFWVLILPVTCPLAGPYA